MEVRLANSLYQKMNSRLTMGQTKLLDDDENLALDDDEDLL
jgi:hypothetical protein